MRTPAGRECVYFYGDYYRGRKKEECRLLQSATPPLAWKPALCRSCPVPDIQLANSCEYMRLTPTLKRSLPFAKNQVAVHTYCTKTQRQGFDAHIGCGECHPLPPAFLEAER